MGKIADITGQRFGRLVVIEPHPIRAKNRDVRWICKCDCGNVIITTKNHLVTRVTQSCGCLQKELVAKRCHKHGLSKTKLSHIRSGMVQRCYNPKETGYKNYGGRGITVCDEWRYNPTSFFKWAYTSGYEEDLGLSIERINNDGNYCPENCKWATRKEQNNNTRKIRWITFNNETKTMTQWSEKTVINLYTLFNRLVRLNWSIEKALTTKVRKMKRK